MQNVQYTDKALDFRGREHERPVIFSQTGARIVQGIPLAILAGAAGGT